MVAARRRRRSRDRAIVPSFREFSRRRRRLLNEADVGRHRARHTPAPEIGLPDRRGRVYIIEWMVGARFGEEVVAA